jgi:ribosomal protein L12E/L44/L45/RPP1/RPP2
MSKTNKNKPSVVKANSKSEVDLSEVEGILSASEKDSDLDEVIESNCSMMTAIATATSTTVTSTSHEGKSYNTPQKMIVTKNDSKSSIKSSISSTTEVPKHHVTGKRITVKDSNGLSRTVRFTLQNIPIDAEPIIAQRTPITTTIGEICSIPETYDVNFKTAADIVNWTFEPQLNTIHPALLPLRKKQLDAIVVTSPTETTTNPQQQQYKRQKTSAVSKIYDTSRYEFCNCYIWQAYFFDTEGEKLYENINDRDVMLKSRSEDIEKVIAWVTT